MKLLGYAVLMALTLGMSLLAGAAADQQKLPQDRRHYHTLEHIWLAAACVITVLAIGAMT